MDHDLLVKNIVSTVKRRSYSALRWFIPLLMWPVAESRLSPELGVGDVVYNGVHQYLVESGNGGIQQWIEALDTIAALQPRRVVASHKNPALDDDPKAIEETRSYLEDSERLSRTSHSALEFYNSMMELYPKHPTQPPCGSGAPRSCFLSGWRLTLARVSGMSLSRKSWR